MAKILLVEDDTTVALEVANALRDRDYLVDIASSGDEARAYFCASGYDLAILDWELPDTTGVELCQEIRSSASPGVPVLFLTGRSAVADKERGFESGADDYLTKPFHRSELLARVNALLKRSPIIKSRQVTIRDITLDRDSHQVLQAGKTIKLAPREFALLEFLMTHPKEVFTGDALLRRLWPTDSESSAETVRVTLGTLRQKLTSPDAKPLIITLKGIGYRLDP